MTYRAINSRHVVETLNRLHERIQARFPGRGIGAVCQELADIAARDARRAQELAKPYIFIRAAVAAVLALGAAPLFFLLREVKLPSFLTFFKSQADAQSMLNFFSGVDSLVNLLLLVGGGIFFLLQFEERRKRRLALADLHQLRAIAHVIDMHQLTKDPTMLGGQGRLSTSPERDMDAFQLARYLDYCSEMLSLAAKVAALYAQSFRDPVIIEAVNDLETLTTNLSRKIWQKIALLKGQAAGGA